MKAINLMYHDVTANGREDSSGFPGRGAARYKLTPERFDAHLHALRQIIPEPPGTIDTVDLARQPTALFLTFDDGGVSGAEIADRLESFGWYGHFFMTAAFVDRPGFLRRGDLRDLRRRGHVIGSHSFSHPLRMARWPAARLRDEWTRSAALLSGILGEPIVAASVPGGHHSQEVAHAAAEAGIRFLFTSEPRARVRRMGEMTVLGRYAVTRSTDPELMARVASGSLAPRLRQLVLWDLKRAAKAIAGTRYLAIRDRLLGGDDLVRLGE